MDTKIIKKIGDNTKCQVYICQDEAENWLVCKKGDESGALKKEAEILKGLTNQIFPRFIAYDEADKPTLYREFLPGMTLTKYLSSRHFISVEKAVEFTLSIAEGLNELHNFEDGFALRDLKPDNILIGIDGKVKLIDLGSVGAFGEKNVITGNREFSAPEQFEKDSPCQATMDVYSLTAILFYMMVGYSPNFFSVEENKADILKAVGLKKKMRTFILSCLSNNPQERCPDIPTFKNELLLNCDKPLKNFLTGKGVYFPKKGRFFVKENLKHIGKS